MYIHIHKSTYREMYVCVYTYVHTYTYLSAYLYVHVPIYMYTLIAQKCVYYVYIHILHNLLRPYTPARQGRSHVAVLLRIVCRFLQSVLQDLRRVGARTNQAQGSYTWPIKLTTAGIPYGRVCVCV